MKRGITFILVVLFLVFRQGEPFLQIREHVADKVIIEEAAFIFDESGLGFIKDNDRTDPFDLMYSDRFFSNTGRALNQDIVNNDIIQAFLFHPNLLLIDKPPPSMTV